MIGFLQKVDNMQYTWIHGQEYHYGKGTSNVEMEDHKGTTHNILIANTLYAPKAPFHLLSTQHWSQQSADLNGTYLMIQHDKMILK